MCVWGVSLFGAAGGNSETPFHSLTPPHCPLPEGSLHDRSLSCFSWGPCWESWPGRPPVLPDPQGLGTTDSSAWLLPLLEGLLYHRCIPGAVGAELGWGVAAGFLLSFGGVRATPGDGMEEGTVSMRGSFWGPACPHITIAWHHMCQAGAPSFCPGGVLATSTHDGVSSSSGLPRGRA